MKKLGLGIIGLGYIGKVHFKHSLELANVRPIAICDTSKRALKTARSNEVKAFTNYQELLKDPDVDAVVIALPTHLHSECAISAAEAGKHIFIEKPLARNVEEGRTIISASRRNAVKLMVGYPLRFKDIFRDLRTRVDSGLLGSVEVAHAVNIASGPFSSRGENYVPTPVPDWWFNKELTGGGALIDLGSHMINLLRWYFGEVTDIRCTLGYRFNLDIEDSASCWIKFKSGTLAVVNVGWFSEDFVLKVELFGTAKHEVAQDPPSNPILTAIQMLRTGTSGLFLPHLIELQYFVNCISKDLSPSPSGVDALRDLEAISQAYKNTVKLV